MASVSPTPRLEVRVQVRDAGPAPGLLDAFEPLRREAYPWLLDSALADGRLGRFSFAGSDPWVVLRARGRELELQVRRRVHPSLRVGTHRRTGDAFAWLRELVPASAAGASGSEIPFVGGAVGYFGYELAEQLEPVRLPASEGTAFPDLAFLLVDALLAYDHEAGRLHACGLGFGRSAESAGEGAERRTDACLRTLRRGARRPAARGPSKDPAPTRARLQHDARSYGERVGIVGQGIADGDLYQACLTHRIEADFDGEPWPLYRRLREGNPAPFAAYLELPEGAIASSSPERFLRVDAGGRVEARPIKGTSEVDERDPEASRAALAVSAKDRAENVMIVDLYRNDLGRVCRAGSVRVPELCAIERYGGLHQMVSTVTGRLAEGRDRLDLVCAAFPPGSMTGAPKIAAMRLLAELEPVRRGVYAGALGYLDARGGMDLSVVIRTILLSEGRAHVHVGGGIVADSRPDAEYRETLDKARAPLAALRAEIPGEPPREAPPAARPAARATAAPPNPGADR